MEQTAIATNGTREIEIRNQLAAIRQIVPEDRQLSWLQLCVGKATMKEALEKKELELQKLLIGFDNKFQTPEILSDEFWMKITVEQKQNIVNALVELQNDIAGYKKGLRDMPEIRKAFTRYLDKIYEELMVPEKRAAAWETLNQAEKFYLSVREKKEKHDAQLDLKKTERDNFIAHVKNEYLRLASEYRLALEKQIKDAYVWALNDKNLTEDGLKQYIRVTWDEMKKIQPAAPQKFNYHYNTKEEIIAIAETLEKPDYISILNITQKSLLSTFDMYWNDRVKPEQAKEYQEKHFDGIATEVRTDVQRAIGVNNLLSASGATSITPKDSDLKKSTSRQIIVVKDDSPEWANKIVAAFLKDWPTASQHLRIKKWGNLNVGQMAAALDDAEIKVAGIEYETEVK